MGSGCGQRVLVNLVALSHIPLTFYLCFSEHGPRVAGEFVYADVTEANDIGGLYHLSVSMTPICIPASIMFAHAFSQYGHMTENSDSWGSFDEGQDIGDSRGLFWYVFCVSVCIRFMLLVSSADIFAIILLCLLWCISVYLSCRRIPDTRLLYVRILAMGLFFLSNLLLCGVMVLVPNSTSSAYIIGCSVILDMLLIIGHTWDYPECTHKTVYVCRYFYLFCVQVSLLLCIGENRQYL